MIKYFCLLLCFQSDLIGTICCRRPKYYLQLSLLRHCIAQVFPCRKREPEKNLCMCFRGPMNSLKFYEKYFEWGFVHLPVIFIRFSESLPNKKGHWSRGCDPSGHGSKIYYTYLKSKMLHFAFYFSWFSGRDETMQPAKPSFLEYFEQKEKENQINSFGKSVSGPLKSSSDWKVPQDGDYEFVSSVRSKWSCLLGKVIWNITHSILSFYWKCLSIFLYSSGVPTLAAASRPRASPVWENNILTDIWAVLGPPVSGTFFALKILYSLAIFLFVEFEIVNGERNI